MQWWQKQESPCFSCGECQLELHGFGDNAYFVKQGNSKKELEVQN
jgi:hypothetical protein